MSLEIFFEALEALADILSPGEDACAEKIGQLIENIVDGLD